jgi:hypothetical protein
MLERIQSRFIRFIGLGFEYHEVPVQDLQLQFNLRPLHVRRNISDVMSLKKLITSVIDAPDCQKLCTLV